MSEKENKKECFVIMPISDQEGYNAQHFNRVYENLIRPIVESAGFSCKRADQVKETNLIQADIINRLTTADLVICDLSSQNPNVMYELGIRHAYDMPVVLIKDDSTSSIFDISGLRYTEYPTSLVYHEVIEFHEELAAVIEETINGDGINSLIKLAHIDSRAVLPIISDTDVVNVTLSVMKNDIEEMKDTMRYIRKSNDSLPRLSPVRSKVLKEMYEEYLEKEVTERQWDYLRNEVSNYLEMCLHHSGPTGRRSSIGLADLLEKIDLQINQCRVSKFPKTDEN